MFISSLVFILNRLGASLGICPDLSALKPSKCIYAKDQLCPATRLINVRRLVWVNSQCSCISKQAEPELNCRRFRSVAACAAD